MATSAERRRAQARGRIVDIAPKLYNVPVLMEWARLDAIRAASIDPNAIDFEAFFLLFDEDRDAANVKDGIATIEIRGPIFGFRLSRIQKQLDKALGDDSVRGILLNVDSPGGQVAGTFDLTDRIHAARERKPIWAIANDDAFSAAYAIASAAQRVSLTRTGGVGSVGVIAVHVEFSKMDERVGVTFTPVFAGERKNDYADTEPLNDTARGLLQAEVNRLRELFSATVARNRGMDSAAVNRTEAGLFFGPRGVEIGFADAVESFDQTFAAFRDSLNRGARGAALTRRSETMDPETPATTEEPTPTAAAEPAEEPTNVVSIDTARKEGAADEAKKHAERVKGIRQACELAGCPDRFGEFLDSELTVEQVGKKLLEERAAGAGEEIDGRHTAAGGAAEPVIDTASVYKRWNDPTAFAGGKRAS